MFVSPEKVLLTKRANSFDIETTGTKPYRGGDVFAFCIGDQTGAVEVVRMDESPRKRKMGIERLREFFSDTGTAKIAHNMKFELSFMKKYIPQEILDETIWHDTMTMSQELDNLSMSHALDRLTVKLCDYPTDLDKIVMNQFRARGNFQRIDKELMRRYQIADGERTMLLFLTFYPAILKDRPLFLDYRNEIDLAITTQRMEEHGLRIHGENINSMIADYSRRVHDLTLEAGDILGYFVNLGSDDDIAKILFGQYKIPPVKLTESDRESTDKDVLLELRQKYDFPILDTILKYRSFSKSVASMKSYIEHAAGTDRIHTNVQTNRAKTGRQSSSDPNLQNVSKSAALKNPYAVPLRKCFRAEKDSVLLLPDYSGIEMRLIADTSGETELIDIFTNGGDAHYPTVECFLMPERFDFVNDEVYLAGVREAARLKEEEPKQFKIVRGGYKNTGFCVAYGGGVNKVAFTLARPVDEIRAGDANYRKRFPKISGFVKTLSEQVRRHGYVKTAFGRKLYIPRDKAYVAANFIIQGTAAGVLKRAENRLAYFLKKEFNDRIRLILTVHDEILFDFPRLLLPHKDWILPELGRLMVDMPEIRTPLEVEWKMTEDEWNSAEEFKLVKVSENAFNTKEAQRIRRQLFAA